MSDRETSTESGQDVVFVAGKSGDDLNVIRFRDEKVELGQLRTPKEGEPIKGELLRLKSRQESPRLFDAETIALDLPGPVRRSSGPAQVATERYQRNWEQIFGKKNLPN